MFLQNLEASKNIRIFAPIEDKAQFSFDVYDFNKDNGSHQKYPYFCTAFSER